MSRLRAITARFGAHRKRDQEDPRTQADGAAAASATADEQSRPGAGPDEIDNPAAASSAASLPEFEADGAALREGGQPAAFDAASAPDAVPRPPQGALRPVDRVVRSIDRPAGGLRFTALARIGPSHATRGFTRGICQPAADAW